MRSIFLTFSTRRKRSRTCLTSSVSISYATEMFCVVQHSSNFWFVELQWHWHLEQHHHIGMDCIPAPPLRLRARVVGILIPLSDSFESVHSMIHSGSLCAVTSFRRWEATSESHFAWYERVIESLTLALGLNYFFKFASTNLLINNNSVSPKCFPQIFSTAPHDFY